jgi:hypothetical protein
LSTDASLTAWAYKCPDLTQLDSKFYLQTDSHSLPHCRVATSVIEENGSVVNLQL